MLRASPFDLSTLILAELALTFGLVASMLWFVLPSLAFPVIAGGLVNLYSHE